EEYHSRYPDDPLRVPLVEDQHPEVPPEYHVCLLHSPAVLYYNPDHRRDGLHRLEDRENLLVLGAVGDEHYRGELPLAQDVLYFPFYLPVGVDAAVWDTADDRDLAPLAHRLEPVVLLYRREERVGIGFLWVGDAELG